MKRFKYIPVALIALLIVGFFSFSLTVFAASISYSKSESSGEATIYWNLNGEEAAEFRYLKGAYDEGAYDSATPVGSGDRAEITVSENGEYTVFALAQDGTRLAAVVAVTTVDNLPPEINLTSIEQDSDGTYTVHYTASDGFSIADTRIISGAQGKDAFNSAAPIGGGVLTDLVPGEYTIFAKDEAGNIASYPFSLRATEASSEWSSEWSGYSSTEWEYEYYDSDFKISYQPMETGTAEISKQDITTGQELPGAKLELLDRDLGETVDAWTSGTSPHYVSGLVPGRWYTLVETTAPHGYDEAESIDFQIRPDGTTTRIVMMDERTERSESPEGGEGTAAISKQDATTSEELPGAELTVEDLSDGTVVDQWTSGTSPHYVYGLIPGRTYRLTEVTAPYGYKMAESIDFTVRGDGSVTKIRMKDAPEGAAPATVPTNAPAQRTEPKARQREKYPQTGGLDGRMAQSIIAAVLVALGLLGLALGKRK